MSVEVTVSLRCDEKGCKSEQAFIAPSYEACMRMMFDALWFRHGDTATCPACWRRKKHHHDNTWRTGE